MIRECNTDEEKNARIEVSFMIFDLSELILFNLEGSIINEDYRKFNYKCKKHDKSWSKFENAVHFLINGFYLDYSILIKELEYQRPGMMIVIP